MKSPTEVIAEFLNDLSSEEALKLIHHLKDMMRDKGIRIIREFAEQFESPDPIDGLIASTVAHILSNSTKKIYEYVSKVQETNASVKSADLANIMITVLQKVTNEIEKQIETAAQTDIHTH